MVELGAGGSVENIRLINFQRDAIKVMGGNSRVERCYIRDNSDSDVAHRDGIQLIPKSKGMLLAQYAAHHVSDVLIYGNEIHAHKSKLQGIFGSDGLFFDLNILNNVINTQSDHKITINGMMSGSIMGNVDHEGNPVPVALNPLRIGGAVRGCCVWVVGFKQDYKYEHIKTCDLISDNRTTPFLKEDHIYLDNFDKQKFDEEARLWLAAGVAGGYRTEEICAGLQAIACECGVELN